jgi:hypothetical protein
MPAKILWALDPCAQIASHALEREIKRELSDGAE